MKTFKFKAKSGNITVTVEALDERAAWEALREIVEKVAGPQEFALDKRWALVQE